MRRRILTAVTDNARLRSFGFPKLKTIDGSLDIQGNTEVENRLLASGVQSINSVRKSVE